MVTKLEIEELIDFKTQEIISNRQTHGRTVDEITANVRRGVEAEFHVAETLGLEFNSHQKFDSSDPDTFAYDLIGPDGKTYEVKSLSGNNSNQGWLNVNQRTSKISGTHYGKYPDVQTSIKYNQYIDFIIFVENAEDINIKYMFKMADFVRNLRPSRFNNPKNNSTHYLNPKGLNLI
jgi:hypothetical protein